MFAQRAIALLRLFMGGKKCDPHVLPLQYLSHPWRNAHVSGVKGQINRLFTRGRTRQQWQG
jgi:hypothetical protein